MRSAVTEARAAGAHQSASMSPITAPALRVSINFTARTRTHLPPPCSCRYCSARASPTPPESAPALRCKQICAIITHCEWR